MGGVGDRAAKWMRYIARALTVIWAGFWTIFIVGAILWPTSRQITWDPLRTLFTLAHMLVIWVSAAIAWRWEAAGGVVLVLEGLFLLFIGPIIAASLAAIVPWLPTALPALVIGVLFLASWWKSEASAGIRDATALAAQLMRYIARTLALIWAVFWTFFGLACSFVVAGLPFGPGGTPEEFFLENFALLCLVALVSVSIAWRWEAMGGVALVLAGLVSFIALPPNSRGLSLWLPLLHLPPLIAGFLFLASWWKSGRSAGARDATALAAQLMRYIAWALALIWTLWWVFAGLYYSVILGLLLCLLSGRGAAAECLQDFALPGLVALVSVGIAWRWEAIGGVALVLASLLSFIAFPWPLALDDPSVALFAWHLPPLVAGLLFLASWWLSRRSGDPQNR